MYEACDYHADSTRNTISLLLLLVIPLWNRGVVDTVRESAKDLPIVSKVITEAGKLYAVDLPPNILSLMDNASIHHTGQAVLLIEEIGAIPLFLPPYSRAVGRVL